LQLYLKSRIIRAQDSKVVIECETGVNYLNVDKICALSEPVLNLPKYNGTKLLGAHIDKEMCILGNQNLRVIGDSSGTMTVTEAEYISRQVAKSILNGIPIQYEICSFPQKIESKLPLCISGEMDTMYIAAEKWRYVDFKFLGWSLVRRTSGRLWYLFDAKTEKITAMHIYHERSVELISLATLLMKYKITDRVWEESMLHPSPVEIFMTLSKRIIDEMRL
jgi:pyruvate/2-oxoglutarate dehydrogenase complex dihydrolipoamide dehydrogenase (E3) component